MPPSALDVALRQLPVVPSVYMLLSLRGFCIERFTSPGTISCELFSVRLPRTLFAALLGKRFGNAACLHPIASRLCCVWRAQLLGKSILNAGDVTFYVEGKFIHEASTAVLPRAAVLARPALMDGRRPRVCCCSTRLARRDAGKGDGETVEQRACLRRTDGMGHGVFWKDGTPVYQPHRVVARSVASVHCSGAQEVSVAVFYARRRRSFTLVCILLATRFTNRRGRSVDTSAPCFPKAAHVLWHTTRSRT